MTTSPTSHYDKTLYNLLKEGLINPIGVEDISQALNVAPSACALPAVKKTVTYIVAAVCLNDQSDVLLIQEAKKSCRGLWYLPAGRLEPGETLVEGIKREVKEEAGLDFNPSCMVGFEWNQNAHWYRVSFTGTVTGSLKTAAQADSESLQAAWVSPSQMGQGSFRIRVFVISCLSNRKTIFSSLSHPPMFLTVRDMMQEIFRGNAYELAIRILSVLNIEHLSTVDNQTDGLSVCFLISVNPDSRGVPPEPCEKYSWLPVSNPELSAELVRRLNNDEMINIPVLN